MRSHRWLWGIVPTFNLPLLKSDEIKKPSRSKSSSMSNTATRWERESRISLIISTSVEYSKTSGWISKNDSRKAASILQWKKDRKKVSWKLIVNFLEISIKLSLHAFYSLNWEKVNQNIIINQLSMFKNCKLFKINQLWNLLQYD